jgi:hypothetical protein
MTTKERLHRLVDELTEVEAEHARIVIEDERSRHRSTLAGSLPDLPDLSWEDFESASELARHDIASA